MNKIKPNIILASYPRSGNTYLRNILLDVYKIFSWNNIEKYNQAFDKVETLEKRAGVHQLSPERENKLKLLKSQVLFPVIKTHDMPAKILHLCDENPIIIYLVRDGRDALVSMAHHNVDIVEPGSDFSKSLQQSIKASSGSHFGGWAKNVMAWREIAHRVIFFEELIKNPLEVAESLREILKLPEPDVNKIPTFESQREGKSYFGGQSRTNYTDKEKREFNEKFFRSGKINGWKNEMTPLYQKLFWKFHGKVAGEMGYNKDGSFTKTKWSSND